MKYLIILFLTFSLNLSAKVYDCFMFSNELDILELRLNELYPYVDHFVLVEWNKTHRTNNDKLLYFDLYKDRFVPFLDKIIHVKLDDIIEPNTGDIMKDGWIRENWHRNQIMRGLTNAKDEDIIFISDADEYYPGERVAEIANATRHHQVMCLAQKMYFWFLNRYNPQLQCLPCTGVCTFKYLKQKSPQGIRVLARSLAVPCIWTGWHFTWMGGYEMTNEKTNNIVEGNGSKMTYEEWRAHVNHWPKVEIDETYPKFVRENIKYLLDIGLIDY